MRALFVTDLDETLFDRDRRLPAANRQAIERATSAGVAVAVVTGRRLGSMRGVYPHLEGLDLRFGISNGSVVLAPDNETPEAVVELDWALAEALAGMQELSSAPLLCITAPHCDPDVPDCHIRAPDSRAWMKSWTPHDADTWLDSDEATGCSGRLVHLALHVETRQAADRAREAVRDRLRELPGAPPFASHVVHAPVGTGALVELVPVGGKGLALRHLAETLGVDADATGAVGDEFNDWDLLDAARHRYAVAGSALAEARSDAQVVASAGQGGVADALERFMAALG